AAQQLTARVTVAIGGGKTDRLALTLPPGADRVRVTGPDVREARPDGNGMAVFLRGSIGGQTRLTVRCELPRGADVRRLPGLGVSDGHWASGTVVVTNTAGGSEVLPEQADGLKPLALADVPDDARALLAGPTALAYTIAARQWSLAVDVVNLGEFALRESIADLAHYEVAFLDDGAFLCKARYEVRNRARQFLRVQLPPKAIVLLARVNEKSTPLSPVPGGTDAWLLPLVRSTASVEGLVSFPVEIVFTARTAALARRGALTLPLPRIDLPIAYAWANAYLPEGMTVSRWAGPMKAVDQFSSESATASLGYGRGLAAEGYKGMAKPTTGKTTKTPTPAPPQKKKPARRAWFGLAALLPGTGSKDSKADKPPGDEPEGPAVTKEEPETVESEEDPDDEKPTDLPDKGPNAKPTKKGKRKGEPVFADKSTPATPALKAAQPQPAQPTPQVIAGYQGTLGRNYWRAGKDFYDNNDFANAEKNFSNVVKLNPKSVEATNARRLLSNIKMSQGKLSLKSRSAKAAGARVQHEIGARNKALEDEQLGFVQKGLKLSREGRTREAKDQFKAAQAVGGQLLRQGASAQDQESRLREVEHKLGVIQKQERGEADKLYEKAQQFVTKGDLNEAARTVNKLRRYDSTRGQDLAKKIESQRFLTESKKLEEVTKSRTYAGTVYADTHAEQKPQRGRTRSVNGGATAIGGELYGDKRAGATGIAPRITHKSLGEQRKNVMPRGGLGANALGTLTRNGHQSLLEQSKRAQPGGATGGGRRVGQLGNGTVVVGGLTFDGPTPRSGSGRTRGGVGGGGAGGGRRPDEMENRTAITEGLALNGPATRPEGTDRA
ncbi:hypothetical protein HQ560_06860, partial [bacterium]|nr:hypothetical protein [bacterium]